MWRLVSILELADYDKRILLTTPQFLESLQMLVNELFKGLFCQRALSLFEQSDNYGKSWLQNLRRDLSQRIPEMQLTEIEQMLDKNLYGDLRSSRTDMKSPDSILKQSPEKGATSVISREGQQQPAKDLYEVMIDLAIFILVRLCQPAQDSAGDASDRITSEPVDMAGDLQNHIVNTFIKHLRDHEKLAQK